MKSTNRAYLPAVDHLRAFAAVLVLLYHCAQLLRGNKPGPPAFDAAHNWVYTRNPLQTIITEGHTGVALFMVLSGFILTTGSLGRPLRYGAFIRNRFLRVGPLFLVLLLVAAVTSSASFSLSAVLQTMLGFATFSGGFTAGPFAMLLWTVGVEFQFYLVFPVLLRLLNERGPRTIVLLLASMAFLRTLAILSAPAGVDVNQVTYYSIVGRIDQFLIGMIAAVVFARCRDRLAGTPLLATATAAAVGMLWTFNQLHGYVEGGSWRSLWVDVEGLVWGAVIVTYVANARVARARIGQILAALGTRSYSIYLLHMPILFLAAERAWHVSPTGLPPVDAFLSGLLIVLPITIALATLTFAAIERPFLSLRVRYLATTSVKLEHGAGLTAIAS